MKEKKELYEKINVEADEITRQIKKMAYENSEDVEDNKIIFSGNISESSKKFLKKEKFKRWIKIELVIFVVFVAFVAIYLSTNVLQSLFGPLFWIIVGLGSVAVIIIPIIGSKTPLHPDSITFMDGEIFTDGKDTVYNGKITDIKKVLKRDDYYYLFCDFLGDGVILEKNNIIRGDFEEVEKLFWFQFSKGKKKTKF